MQIRLDLMYRHFEREGKRRVIDGPRPGDGQEFSKAAGRECRQRGIRENGSVNETWCDGALAGANYTGRVRGAERRSLVRW